MMLLFPGGVWLLMTLFSGARLLRKRTTQRIDSLLPWELHLNLEPLETQILVLELLKLSFNWHRIKDGENKIILDEWSTGDQTIILGNLSFTF